MAISVGVDAAFKRVTRITIRQTAHWTANHKKTVMDECRKDKNDNLCSLALVQQNWHPTTSTYCEFVVGSTVLRVRVRVTQLYPPARAVEL